MTPRPNKTLPNFAVLMDQTRFWVIHRRRFYGPFDYQWSLDLNGIELLYQQEKYGECCSDEEFFADLKPFRLPSKVVQVATIVLGTIISSIFHCAGSENRIEQIGVNLEKAGLERYTINQQAVSE